MCTTDHRNAEHLSTKTPLSQMFLKDVHVSARA